MRSAGQREAKRGYGNGNAGKAHLGSAGQCEAKRNIDSLRKTIVAMAKKFSIFEAKAAESQNKNRERERELEATIAKQKKELAALRRERPKHRAQIKAVAAAITVAPPTAAPVAKKRACTVPQRSQKMPKTSASER